MNPMPKFLLQLATPPAPAAPAAPSHNIIDIITSSDPVVKAVLAILVIFSIVSWAIIFFKYFQLKRAQKSSQKFNQMFDQSFVLDEVLTKPAPQTGNPLYAIFSAGMSEILRYKQLKAKDPAYRANLNPEHIHRHIRRAQNDEMLKLEQLTPFLATTASTAPFIGLFGTVWGILVAFFKIGQQGSAGLAVVGPYIAEALVATAVGLAAAIPAVIAYNYFVARIRNLSNELGNFSSDLEHRIEKEYF